MRTIEIDFDIHKAIELERRGFEDTPNAALRRLLGIGDEPQEAASAPTQNPHGWHERGVSLPHGTRLRMDYSGRRYEGEISNGRWVVEGKAFVSPSGAASGVGRTRGGKLTRLDGWRTWEIKRPGDSEFVSLKSLELHARGDGDALIKQLGLD